MNKASSRASANVGGSFDLIDHDGCPVTNETYFGRYVLLFFGFTHCRVVCPRALGKLSIAVDTLGPLADGIQPLYVTVDPERDTPEAMRAFLQTYPRFVGLTGPPERIARAKKAFRVFARRAADPLDKEGYAVPHTAITYVLDRSGALVWHFTDVLSSQEISERLRSLLTAPVSMQPLL